MATLITSSDETDDIMKMLNWLKESGLLIKSVGETIKNEAKKTKEVDFSAYC